MAVAALIVAIVAAAAAVVLLVRSERWQSRTERAAHPRLVLASEVLWLAEDPDQWAYWITVTNHGGSAIGITLWGLSAPGNEVLDAPLSSSPDMESDIGSRIKAGAQVNIYFDGPGVCMECDKAGLRPEDVHPFVAQTTGETIVGPALPNPGNLRRGPRQVR